MSERPDSEFPLTIPGERAKEDQKRAEVERVAALKAEIRHVLRDPVMRAHVWQILTELGLYATTRENNVDIYRAEGRRAAALALRSTYLRHAPDLYRLMEDEALARSTNP